MSQFALKRHFPTKVDYWVSEEAPDGPFTIESAVSASGGPNASDPSDWRVSVDVTFTARTESKVILKGAVTYVGFFNAPHADGEQLERFMIGNGTSLLYSAVRELVVNLSARTLANLVVLPPAHFGKNFLIKKEESKPVKAARV